MWFPPDDGVDFYDFELEPGGPGSGYNDRTDELRRTILYLVREKNSMLVKLRGLSALREVLQSLYENKVERDRANFFECTSKLGAEISQELVVCAGAGTQLPIRQAKRAEKLQKDEVPAPFKDDKKQDVDGVHNFKVSCFCFSDKCNPIPHRL